jgi:hypothetical protein
MLSTSAKKKKINTFIETEHFHFTIFKENDNTSRQFDVGWGGIHG